MMNVHDILEKSREAGQRLPYNEAAVLFAAAVRLAAAGESTVRGRLVQIDEAGGLHLETFDENEPEAEPAYLAPELLSSDAPDRDDPKVQVYAAGVLGYELLTGKLAPRPGRAPGAELSGPLGDVVRRALAVDRRERIEDLRELQEAVEEVQPRPPAEGERNILSALRSRFSRPPPEKEALARLIEKLHQLETQVSQLAKAQARLDASQRESSETIERFEVGQTRAGEARRRQSVVVPAAVAAAFTSLAILGAAWAFGLLTIPVPPRTAASPPSAPADLAETPPIPDAAVAEARPPRAETKRAAVEAKPAPPEPRPAPEPKAAPPEPKPGLPAAAEAAADAGSVAAGQAEEEDAGLAAVAADAGPPQAAAEPPPAVSSQAVPPPSVSPPPKRPQAPDSHAAMLHALALSQVRRGESALEQGNADEALASFRAALENEPTIALAFRGLGMAYAMQGHDAQALQAYDRYLRLTPKAPDAAEIRQSIRELRARAKVGAKDQ